MKAKPEQPGHVIPEPFHQTGLQGIGQVRQYATRGRLLAPIRRQSPPNLRDQPPAQLESPFVELDDLPIMAADIDGREILFSVPLPSTPQRP